MKTIIDLTTPEKCLAYLRSLGDAPVSLPSAGEMSGPAADAVSTLAEEHASVFARNRGRWEWTASELVEEFTPEFFVRQDFKGLGHDCRAEFYSESEAESHAELLVDELAQMIADWPTPDTRTAPSGTTLESRAWEAAALVIGLAYDERGNRTPGSPRKWGAVAGKIVARMAVSVDRL